MQYGYNTYNQYGGYYDPYQQQQMMGYEVNQNYNPYQNYSNDYYQPQQGYVFSPVMPQNTYGYYPYQQQQMMNYGYGQNYNLYQDYNNGYYQPQQYNYGQYRQQYSYENPYGNLYGGYNNYNNGYYQAPQGSYSLYGTGNYLSASAAQRDYEQKNREAFQTLMIKNAYRVNGKTITDEEIHKMLHPEIKITERDREIARMDQKHMEMVQLSRTLRQMENMNIPSYDPMLFAYMEQQEKLKKYEDKSKTLFQFFNEGLPCLIQEQWEDTHLDRRGSHNLSKAYNSSAYNELLKMHMSNNSYVNQLLDDSRYDNNFDIGMDNALREAMHGKSMLERKVPDSISSPEEQKRRAAFTQEIINQIYKKGGSVNVQT